MLTSTSLARALCLLVCVSAVCFAQSKRPRRPPAASPAVSKVALPRELANFFPATTSMYVEARNLGEIFDRTSGSLEEFYKSMSAALAGKAGGSAKLPLTLEEVRTLLGSDLALGGSLWSRTGPEMLLVVRTPSPEASAVVRNRVLPLLLSSFPKYSRRRETVAGQPMTILVPPGAKGASASFSLAYAVAGETVVFGDAKSVRGLFAPAAPDAPKLASSPAFSDARGRLSSAANTFMWVDPASAFGRTFLRTGSESVDAAVAGLGSVRGIAVATEMSGDVGRTEILLELDRSKETLVTLLADPPAVSLRAAALLPANAHLVASVGFEPARVFDFLRAHAPKADARHHLLPDAEQWAKGVEARVGVKAREELLAALGDEFTVAFDFGPVVDAMKTGGAGGAGPTVLFLVEVTQPETAQRALARYFAAGAAEATERDYNGVAVTQAGDVACAVVDGIAVVGPTASVERALDAHRTGETLFASPDFVAARGRMSNNTVAALYVSPQLGVLMMASLKESGMLPPGGFPAAAMTQTPVPFVATVSKEDLGLYASSEAGPAVGVAFLGIIGAIAIPSLAASRGAANEASAVGMLRTLASAEATFSSVKGRFGTWAELVEARMIDADFVDGADRNGYRLRQVSVTDDTFEFAAEPASPPTGARAFNVVEDYTIRYAEGVVAPKGKSGKILGAE